MNTSKYKLEIWIGLAKVKAKNKKAFKNANNAYVNVVGLANGKSDFRKKTKENLLKNNLILLRIEGVELFSNRIRHYKVDKVLYKLADELLKNGQQVRFSTFHAYRV